MTTLQTIGQIFGLLLVLAACMGVCGRAEIARRVARWQVNRRRRRRAIDAWKGGQ